MDDTIFRVLERIENKQDAHSELLASHVVQLQHLSGDISDIKSQFIRKEQAAMTEHGQHWMAIGIASSFFLGIINLMKSLIGGH